MALTRAEINRGYKERHPDKHRQSMKRTNEKRRLRILKQKEIEVLNEMLAVDRNASVADKAST